MPSRTLIGILFGAAAAVWGLLVGVLIALLLEAGGSGSAGRAPSLGFWLGVALLTAAGAGWGAGLGPALARRTPGAAGRAVGGAGSALRFAAGGALLLLCAGLTALAAGLLLTALSAGAEATWGTVRQALARPSALALPAATVALIGAPFGAAAGVALRAMTPPEGPSADAADGSRRRRHR